jgi:peptidoglycan hydrolase-like protein with peptidoglycan-binding domain
MANTAYDVLNEASRRLGLSGRPNIYTREYAAAHGSDYLNAAWCDMKVTYDARHAGAAKSVLPKGDRAYTVYHAEDFQDAGLWKSGTSDNIIKYVYPGCVVFFDWNGTNVIGAIDHVGYAVRNLKDGRLVTVEGNTGNAVKLRVRGSDVIAGFGTPKYDAITPVVIKPTNTYPYKVGTFIRKGWQNSAGVKVAQNRLNSLGYRPKLTTDGDFGAKTEMAVEWFQRMTNLAVDGVIGPKTWGKMFPAAS